MFISLKDLAVELGMDRSNARKYVLSLGIRPVKRRMYETGNQLVLTVSQEEANQIRRMREKQGFRGDGRPVDQESGSFYVIQLVPDLDPRRIKLGFAADVMSRLAQHRTAAPTAALVTCWPCKRSWESTVMEWITSVPTCRHFINEVFECDDLKSIIALGDQIFQIAWGQLKKPHQKALRCWVST